MPAFATIPEADRTSGSYPSAAPGAGRFSDFGDFTPELYRQNSFRQIGVPVLAGLREISRRVEQLELSAALDGDDGEAGAGNGAPREAARRLRDPRSRFLDEFFWYWPLGYPHHDADDALDRLARGETEAALALWEWAANKGDAAASHNLAVFHHALALDSEESGLDDEEARARWRWAVGTWRTIAADDSFWRLVRNRVGLTADPLLPEEVVAEWREHLPEALAAVHARLVLRHLDAGRTEQAAFQADLIADLLPDGEAVRRSLESCAGPIAARVDLQVREARRACAGDEGRGLDCALALIRACESDLRLLERVCGRESDFFAEVSKGVVDATLDALVAYQRRSGDNRGCVPPLVFVFTLDTTPEMRSRLDETYRVIRSNVAAEFAEAADGDGDPSASGLPAAGFNAVFDAAGEPGDDCRLIAGALLPGLASLGLIPDGAAAFAARVSDWLQAVARRASGDGNADLAAAADSLAAQLQNPLP